MFFVTKALIEKSAHMKLARVARATPTDFFRTAGSVFDDLYEKSLKTYPPFVKSRFPLEVG